MSMIQMMQYMVGFGGGWMMFWSWLTSILIVIVLILLIVWFIKQIKK